MHVHVSSVFLTAILSVCLSVSSNQLSQHDEKERLMEADSANSDLHICVVCMKSLMNTTVRTSALCILYIHRYMCWGLESRKYFLHGL